VAYAQSQLIVLDTVPAPPQGASEVIQEEISRFKSQSCPRFVPSKRGQELVFVAEDPKSSSQSPAHAPSFDEVLPPLLPIRRLATARVPSRKHWVPDEADDVEEAKERRLGDADGNATPSMNKTIVPVTCCNERLATCLACKAGISVETYCEEAGARAWDLGCERDVDDNAFLHAEDSREYLAFRTEAIFLDVGDGALPFAPVRGCPEFVPSLYFSTESIAEAFSNNLFNPNKTRSKLAEERSRDTFVMLSVPASASVLGVDAQVLAVSLPEEAGKGAISLVRLLYNVDEAPVGGRHAGEDVRLRLSGCQPIRAAGAQGHTRLQWVLNSLMTTLNMHTEKAPAWLACLTADQRIAIVASPKRDDWINMSMPYPLWTGKQSQEVWCPDDREEACFEVWSNPNPNV
jgi:hypothetical protein